MAAVLPAPGKTYRGRRDEHGRPVVTVDWEPLPQVVFHSPAGYSWGYGGSGPADLALSILADHLLCHGPLQRYVQAVGLLAGQEIRERHPSVGRAFDLHQAFKIHFLSQWDQDGPWAITAAEIASWLEEQG